MDVTVVVTALNVSLSLSNAKGLVSTYATNLYTTIVPFGSIFHYGVEFDGSSTVNVNPLNVSLSLETFSILSENNISVTPLEISSSIGNVKALISSYWSKLGVYGGPSLFLGEYSSNDVSINVSPLNVSVDLSVANLTVASNTSVDSLQVLVFSPSVQVDITQDSENSDSSVSVFTLVFELKDVEVFCDFSFVVEPIRISTFIGNISVSDESNTSIQVSALNVQFNLLNSVLSLDSVIDVNRFNLAYSVENFEVLYGSSIEVEPLVMSFVSPDLFYVGDSSDTVTIEVDVLDVSVSLLDSVINILISDYGSGTCMPNRNYFIKTRSNYDSESNLYDLVLNEHYSINGVSMVYYIVDYDSSYDEVFGEDLDRYVVRKFNFRANYELPNEEEIWTSFGIEGIDNFHMYVSKRHFYTASTYDENRTVISYPSYIPKQGDVIRSKYNKYYYEVVTVKEQMEMFHQRKHSWDLVVKPYKNEMLSLSATTSASMEDFQTVSSGSDLFDVADEIDSKKDSVVYNPPDIEEEPNDPFAQW